jgi:hypothetical protein
MSQMIDMFHSIVQANINNVPNSSSSHLSPQQTPQPSQPSSSAQTNNHFYSIPSTRLDRLQTLFRNSSTLNSNNTTPPTISRLSNTQIANNTRRILYDASFSEPRCPVSLDDFEIDESVIQIIQCGHYFKSDVLMEWFRRNTHCPVCRYNLANQRVSSQSSDSTTQNNVIVETVDSDDEDIYNLNSDGFSEQFSFEIPIAIDNSGNAYLPSLSNSSRNTLESEIEQTFQNILANALSEYLEHQ